MKTSLEASRPIWSRYLLHLALLLTALVATPLHAARGNAPVAGEIQFITIAEPGNHWSGGTIVVGGIIVILPKNLLIDLPANRLTLKQLFDQAPAACVALGETGLAKADRCNTSGMGGVAAIAANRTGAGNVIAGDVMISKAAESVTGEITYIDYNDGYFRVSGIAGDPLTGAMVRLNDPDGRHTVQRGLGCAAGSPNCSPDPRFTLDGDNYTNVYSTGYPLCIPSLVPRTATIALPGVLTVGANVVANADGSGDLLCPLTNRSGNPVADSRRLAPIQVGDNIIADGNFERVNGVQFLSAHSTMVHVALTTSNNPGQPDYLFLAEVGIDAPGFENQRARTLIIGFSTAPSDIRIWSIHYDPVNNAPHEFPLASSSGCDIAGGGPGNCTTQGIVGVATIFKMRHDVDFLVGANAKVDPCAHLRADPIFGALNICPSSPTLGEGNIAEMLAILSPIPHEIQARTGRSMQFPGMITLDVNGNQATNGQYLFPFGVNLGGIGFAEFNEVNLAALNTPFNFTGLPWTLDRRLSPAGCNGPCEAGPQPLDPYPFEGETMDPRFQTNMPTGPYNDPNYTAALLPQVRNRIFAFVDPTVNRPAGNGFETPAPGNFGVLANVGPTPTNGLLFPPADPAFIPVAVTPLVNPNAVPVAVADTAITVQGVPVTIAVLANDTDPNFNPLSVTAVGPISPAGAGTVVNNGSNVTFTSALLFTGQATFSYTISDGQGGSAASTVSVTVNPAQNLPPVAVADVASTPAGTPVTIAVRANDTDPNGDSLIVTAVTQGLKGAVVNNGLNVLYTPNAGQSGADTFNYTVADGRGGQATGNVTVTIGPAPTIAFTRSDFLASTNEWRLAGNNSTIGATVTVYLGPIGGPVIGTAVVTPLRTWSLVRRNSAVVPGPLDTISVRSTNGAQLVGRAINRLP